MDSNSEQCIDLSAIIGIDNMPPIASLSEHLTVGSRGKKGIIRKMVRSQRTFLELFNKYQSEVRNLQLLIEAKFKKVNVLEERLLELARVLQANTTAYLIKKHRSQQMFALSKFNQNLNRQRQQLNGFYHESTPDQFELDSDSLTGYGHLANSIIEPIVNIHVSDDESINSENNTEQMQQSTKQVDLSAATYADRSSDSTCPDMEESLQSKHPFKGRKGTVPVASKTEFMQLVDKFKHSNNLVHEKVAENVMALRARDSDSILGYQCSMEGCNYMHFLRAQVNRHFKNYHSKTCSHCNQRFKRPLDLLIHLNENSLHRDEQVDEDK